MNDSTNGGGKRPLALYAILERNGKTIWMKVGAAFANRDGSIAVNLDAIPVGPYRLQVREQRAWEDARPTNGTASLAEVQP
jgi:O-succinylbenzoate synthase